MFRPHSEEQAFAKETDVSWSYGFSLVVHYGFSPAACHCVFYNSYDDSSLWSDYNYACFCCQGRCGCVIAFHFYAAYGTTNLCGRKVDWNL